MVIHARSQNGKHEASRLAWKRLMKKARASGVATRKAQALMKRLGLA